MKKIYALFALALVVFACNSVEEPNQTKPDNFNRKEMLTYWANDIIKPAFKDFSSKTSVLEEQTKLFADNPSVASLSSLRDAWEVAYISWQKASLFQVGKAQELSITAAVNTYPVNIDGNGKSKGLKEYIESGNYNLESPNTYSSQGFPALDYLLFGLGTDEETVAVYIDKASYAKYLKDVSTRINSLATKVYNDWNTSYTEIFISEDGYTTTSSVDKMVNYYCIPFYEKQLREPKIVIPAGLRTGIIVPTAAEAYFKRDLSKKLYMSALKATINFYRGVSYDEAKQGQSLQQYLEFLKRKDLANLINTNFDKLFELSNALEDDFSAQVKDADKRAKMNKVFGALQVVLKNFKPDVFSALSVMNSATDKDND